MKALVEYVSRSSQEYAQGWRARLSVEDDAGRVLWTHPHRDLQSSLETHVVFLAVEYDCAAYLRHRGRDTVLASRESAREEFVSGRLGLNFALSLSKQLGGNTAPGSAHAGPGAFSFFRGEPS